MDFIRFKTVLMATILVALASGMGATLQARDASLCASGGVPAGAAEAGAGRCLDVPDAADAATHKNRAREIIHIAPEGAFGG